MANKSFVVQYIIRARERYVATANKVARATEQMTRRIKAAQMQMRGFRDAGLKAAAFITAPMLLIARSFKNTARDAVETRSKFATVFRDIEGQAQTTANALAKNYGLTGTAARGMLGDTGDLLTGFGFAQKEALDLSNRVNELAVDLVSFKNYSGGAKGASEALTKALLGEREQLKSLGIAILENDVKAKVALMRSQGLRFASLRQAKAHATFAIALEQSKNAIGDFARTQEDLATQERITSARIQDMKEAFGRVLLPAALTLTKAIRGVAEWLTELSPATKKVILVVAGVAAVIGPLLLLVAALGVAIPAVTAGFAALAPVAALALGPVLPLLAPIIAAAAILYLAWDKVVALFSGFAKGVRTTLGPTFNRWADGFVKMAAVIGNLFGDDGEATGDLQNFMRVGQMVGEVVGTALDGILRTLMSIGAVIDQVVGALATLDFGRFDLGEIGNIWEGFGQAPEVKIPATASTVGVNVNVGLDEGLKQTTPVATTTRGTRRRADVGLTTAGM